MTAQPMNPADVPHELIEAFERAALMSTLHEDVRPSRYILAAVIPAIRAQVADEITAHFAQERAQVADAEPVTLGGVHEQAKLLGRYDRVIATIDRIARGDQ